MFKHSVFENYNLTDATGEVLLMWLISFLLGLLLGYLIWGSLKRRVSLLEQDLETWKEKYKKTEARNKQLKVALADCRNKKSLNKATASSKPKAVNAPIVPFVKAKTPIASTAKMRTEKPLSEKDNLKVVEGVGPKIESLLNADGINTWIELSNADTDRIRKILDDAGPRYRIHDPSTWPKQAQLAANDQWEELKELQDKLKGGRKV